MYSNWRYTTVISQSTTDADMATPLLTTGTKPREIVQLCAFNGTNTAAAVIVYGIIPSTAATVDTNGQIQIQDLISFQLGFPNADLTDMDEQMALCVVPFGAKGAWGNGPVLIPPNCTLVGWPSINQNGTVVHKCISAESDVGVVPLA